MRNPRTIGLGVSLGLGLALSCPAAASPLRPAAVLRPERGFIDDAMALSPDGATLYFVTTDGATFAELRTARLAGAAGTVPSELSLPGLKLSTTALVPLTEGRVLVVETDPEGQKKTAQAFSLPKRAALPTRLGPATAIVAATVSGAPALVAYTAPDGAAGRAPGDHRFQALSAATLRPLSDRRYRALPGGAVTVPGGTASLLYVGDGYQTIAVKQAGDYDKKADVRQPDRLAILDTLSGKVRRSDAIADPTALGEQQGVLKDHPGEAAFVHIDEARGAIELWTAAPGGFTHAPLKLPRPAATYNAATLRYQPVGDGLLLVSLTVDPQNEAAVARKKSDADTIDLCVAAFPTPEGRGVPAFAAPAGRGVPAGAGAAAAGAAAAGARLADGSLRCLGEIPGNGRPSSWTAAADGTLVLLRKHKGFSRGGAELEVYHLDLGATPGKAAEPPAPKGGAAP